MVDTSKQVIIDDVSWARVNRQKDARCWLNHKYRRTVRDRLVLSTHNSFCLIERFRHGGNSVDSATIDVSDELSHYGFSNHNTGPRIAKFKVSRH